MNRIIFRTGQVFAITLLILFCMGSDIRAKIGTMSKAQDNLVETQSKKYLSRLTVTLKKNGLHGKIPFIIIIGLKRNFRKVGWNS